ncbi:hypothetical protein [Ktedonobacter robiniae]|nr:hypothetical protein [Ktedonobacter robiniae]
MLRGYDPLKEIYQWSLVAYLFGVEVMLFSIALSPIYNNLMFFSLMPFVGLILLYMVFTVAPPLFFVISYRQEKRKRDGLRRAALNKDLALLALYQPSVMPTFSLPLRLERTEDFFSLARLIIGSLLTVFALIICYIPIIYGFWTLPFYLLMATFAFGVFLPLLSLNFAGRIKQRLSRYYLYPSLSIDDDGITAHYDRKAITMHWQDIRYFALTSSTALGRELRTTSLFKREAYEVCDGENIICWIGAIPYGGNSWVNNNWLVEGISWLRSSMAPSERDRQTEILPSLIVAKTGLPLYDLCLPAQKRASQLRERAMSLARRG